MIVDEEQIDDRLYSSFSSGWKPSVASIPISIISPYSVISTVTTRILITVEKIS